MCTRLAGRASYRLIPSGPRVTPVRSKMPPRLLRSGGSAPGGLLMDSLFLTTPAGSRWDIHGSFSGAHGRVNGRGWPWWQPRLAVPGRAGNTVGVTPRLAGAGSARRRTVLVRAGLGGPDG